MGQLWLASKWVRRLVKIPVTSYGYGGVLVAVSPDFPGIAELPMLGFLMVILVKGELMGIIG